MLLDDFDYKLPKEAIAQHPLEQRDRSRLLLLDRARQKIGEALFKDMPAMLRPGDVLVINDTRVKPLRLRAKKPAGGAAELTLVKRLGDGLYECLVKTSKPAPGLCLEVGGGARAVIERESGGGARSGPDEGAPLWLVRFSGKSLDAVLGERGLPPLPPYIRRGRDHDYGGDKERYQTVYAREGEAAAAPTAGLHFTPELIAEIGERGSRVARIRLDVSFGTFAPVRVRNIEDHRMHSESFVIGEEAAELIESARRSGGRVVAVGTTAVRVLEHVAMDDGRVKPASGETDIFIYPGHRFRAVDAMITNFHMPRSTLLMLVSAFAGREFILDAYEKALEKRFRFLSYGDAMLVW